MAKINLHSLVVIANVSGVQGNTPLTESHRIVDLSCIRQEIAGRADNHLYDGDVWQEAYRRTNLLLEHGQGVIFQGGFLQPRDVDTLTQIAHRWGIKLYWHLPALENISHRLAPVYNQVVRKIHKAGKGEILGLYYSFAKLSHTQQPSKILAVGDVHGNLPAMQKAIALAEKEDLFIVWLGDVLDYGSQNLRCIRAAYDSVISDRAHMIWGNHERKISKWIMSNWGQYFQGRLSEANLTTIREIQALPLDSATRFHSAWRALENLSTQHWRVGNFLFTHGAATADMWCMNSHRLSGIHSEHAYFGEVMDSRTKTAEGYPVRTWNWVNRVPDNHTVVVGHDWLDHDSCCVTVKRGSQGGQAICVDTGSSKGGRLASVVIDLQTQTWEARYFDT